MSSVTRAAAIVCILIATAFASSPVGWGADINPGDGPALIESVRADLALIVKAAPAQRVELVKGFVVKSGLNGIEATKRFRNPELHALFVSLLAHADWKVQHRALFTLEFYGSDIFIWPR